MLTSRGLPSDSTCVLKAEPGKLEIKRREPGIQEALAIRRIHMGQYQLLSVLSARLSPLNIDHSRNLPVEICGIYYTEKYTNL